MINSKKHNGFTVIELMFAMAVGTIAVFIFSAYLSRSSRAIRFVDEFTTAVDNAKEGINALNLEIRETKNADNGQFAIKTAEPQSLIFYGDVDNDGVAERIHYFKTGTNFKRGIIEPTGTPATYGEVDEQITLISQYVENKDLAIFTYYDENNNQLTNPISLTNIRLIHTYLEINVTPERAPDNYILENNLHLRNLKAEY